MKHKLEQTKFPRFWQLADCSKLSVNFSLPSCSFTRTLAVPALAACIALLSNPAMAEQVEVTGKATIVNGNIEKAREDAISQALNYASLKAGVNFSSNQQIDQGKLTLDSFQIQRIGAANDVQLVSEIISDDKISVVLRMEVVEQQRAEQCVSQGLKATIMLPKALIKNKRDLAYGQLAYLQRDFSIQFGDALNAYSQYSVANVHADELLDHTNKLTNYRGNVLPSWLSEATDSHYVLQPEITDISVEDYETSLFGLVEHYPERYIKFKLNLYHGISGELVWSDSFESSSTWEFDKSQAVSTSSARFWQSSYGLKLNELFERSLIELDNQLNCRPLLGQIVARQGDRVVLNLGRNNGVKMGDKFQIVLQRNIPDRINTMRAVASKTRANVTIDQVTENTATAIISGIESANNIQINDIAIKI
ncbi:flagellar biosynthesis protein FlgT [Shewanella maritima]|uniref:Flagellar biosynthesis protein FlgT n=1 Tax=Shewanella maritima TaxID=2520507 RepID=A0A411PE53_9GAMM|nr:flagella assembly protein FlgT [Shewanella maritima]QBF81774.1 flagellar biosynthesis protein FlgT [Shewanella maritima]